MLQPPIGAARADYIARHPRQAQLGCFTLERIPLANAIALKAALRHRLVASTILACCTLVAVLAVTKLNAIVARVGQERSEWCQRVRSVQKRVPAANRFKR